MKGPAGRADRPHSAGGRLGARPAYEPATYTSIKKRLYNIKWEESPAPNDLPLRAALNYHTLIENHKIQAEIIGIDQCADAAAAAHAITSGSSALSAAGGDGGAFTVSSPFVRPFATASFAASNFFGALIGAGLPTGAACNNYPNILDVLSSNAP